MRHDGLEWSLTVGTKCGSRPRRCRRRLSSYGVDSAANRGTAYGKKLVMLRGVLVCESLRVGEELAVPLRLEKMWRCEAASATAEQPRNWTLIEFTAPATEAEPLAAALSGCLSPAGGWYADFNTDPDRFVVFAGKVFRYPRGNPAGQAEAKAYGRSVGVPEPQLDWGD